MVHRLNFSASDIHLDASSTDGGHLEVNGQNLLLYKKGSVTLTPRIDNQSDKTQSVATVVVIKENKAEKKIVKLHPVSSLQISISNRICLIKSEQNLTKVCLVR